MQRIYADTVQTQTGDVLTGASVYVYNAGTFVASSIYSDNGITPVTQPLITDGNGQFTGYAANGRYDIRVVKPGYSDMWYRDVQLADQHQGDNAGQDSSGAIVKPSGAVNALSLATINNKLIPSMFGAVGNGITDDTAALNAMFAAAKTYNVPVDWRPGNYLVSNTITINVDANYNCIIRGHGCLLGGTTITAAAAFSGNVIAINGSADPIGRLIHFDIGGFNIAATTLGSGVGLIFNQSATTYITGINKQSNLYDVTIQGFNKCLVVNNSRLIDFDRVTLRNNAVSSVSYCLDIVDDLNALNALAFSGDLNFRNCQFEQNQAVQSYGILIESKINNIAGIKFSRCIWYRCYYGVFLSASNNCNMGDIWFDDGCQFDGPIGYSFYAQQLGATSTGAITDIHINEVYATAVSLKFVYLSPAKQSAINSISVKGCWIAGISFAFCESSGAANIVCHNNQVTGCSYTGGAPFIFYNTIGVSCIGNITGQGGPLMAGGFTNLILLSGNSDWITVQGNNSVGLASGAIVNDTSTGIHKSIANNV